MAESINCVEQVELTEEDILRATTYLPILDKAAMAQVLAQTCIQKMNLGIPVEKAEADTGEKDDAFSIPLPAMYREDTLVRTLTSTFVLLYFYLKRPDITSQYDPNKGMMLSANDYDRYPNLLTQVERMKASSKDREVRDRAYALLADYKDFEKRLGAEIYSLLSVQNDVCTRLTQMMTMQTDPEVLKGALETADNLAGAVKETAGDTRRKALELAIQGGRMKARNEKLNKKLNETAKERFGGGDTHDLSERP